MVKSIHEKTNNANIKALLFLITAPADLIAGAPFRRNVSDEIADGPLLTVLRDDLNFDIDRQPNGVCIHRSPMQVTLPFGKILPCNPQLFFSIFVMGFSPS